MQCVLALLDCRARDLDRFAEDVGKLQPFLAEWDGAARDARHVKEVVDEPHDVFDLALDDSPFAIGSAYAAQIHELERRVTIPSSVNG
jgi:hypothetical protein